MNKLIILSCLALGLFAIALAPVSAQLQPGVFDKYSKGDGGVFSEVYDTSKGNLEESLPAAVGTVISAFLGLVGVIMLVIVVYAGFLWLTAGGNEDQVKKARQWITNAAIGMAITLGAYLITSFVVDQLDKAVTQTPGGTGTPSPEVDPNK